MFVRMSSHGRLFTVSDTESPQGFKYFTSLNVFFSNAVYAATSTPILLALPLRPRAGWGTYRTAPPPPGPLPGQPAKTGTRLKAETDTTLNTSDSEAQRFSTPPKGPSLNKA